MYQAVLDLDLSHCSGRVLLAADVHGSFHVLDEALARIGYDRDRDVVILLGDQIDRGASSHRCLEWINVPGRHSLKGNHESDIEAVCDGRISKADHVEDGGIWFHQLPELERHAYRSAFMAMPLAARILTPGRRRVGLVHADVEGSHFWNFCGHLRQGDYRAERIALTGRSRIAAVRRGIQIPRMTDVDHMFFGHSPVTNPMTVGNCSWIDTGLPHSGDITVVDVDEWVSRR